MGKLRINLVIDELEFPELYSAYLGLPSKTRAAVCRRDADSWKRFGVSGVHHPAVTYQPSLPPAPSPVRVAVAAEPANGQPVISRVEDAGSTVLNSSVLDSIDLSALD